MAPRTPGFLLGIGMIKIGRVAHQEVPLLAAGRKILKGAMVKLQVGKGGIRTAVFQGFGMAGGMHFYPGHLRFWIALRQHENQQAATAAYVQDTPGMVLLRPGAQDHTIGANALGTAVMRQGKVAELERLQSSRSPSGSSSK